MNESRAMIGDDSLSDRLFSRFQSIGQNLDELSLKINILSEFGLELESSIPSAESEIKLETEIADQQQSCEKVIQEGIISPTSSSAEILGDAVNPKKTLWDIYTAKMGGAEGVDIMRTRPQSHEGYDEDDSVEDNLDERELDVEVEQSDDEGEDEEQIDYDDEYEDYEEESEGETRKSRAKHTEIEHCSLSRHLDPRLVEAESSGFQDTQTEDDEEEDNDDSNIPEWEDDDDPGYFIIPVSESDFRMLMDAGQSRAQNEFRSDDEDEEEDQDLEEGEEEDDEDEEADPGDPGRPSYRNRKHNDSSSTDAILLFKGSEENWTEGDLDFVEGDVYEIEGLRIDQPAKQATSAVSMTADYYEGLEDDLAAAEELLARMNVEKSISSNKSSSGSAVSPPPAPSPSSKGITAINSPESVVVIQDTSLESERTKTANDTDLNSSEKGRSENKVEDDEARFLLDALTAGGSFGSNAPLQVLSSSSSAANLLLRGQGEENSGEGEEGEEEGEEEEEEGQLDERGLDEAIQLEGFSGPKSMETVKQSKRTSEIMGQQKIVGADGEHRVFHLKVIFDPYRTGFEDSKHFQPPKGAIVAGRYQVSEVLGQAAFSSALQCVDLQAESEQDEWVCLKVIKNNKEYFDQSLDEIKLLQYINSRGDPEQNYVLRLIDFFYHKEHLFIVSELLRENLYDFQRYLLESGSEPYFTPNRVKRICFQVLHALDYIHSLKLIHCDLKPENIVIKSYSRCHVKLIDFGSSCFITDNLTSYIQSRSYRAPEVILGAKYDYRIDLWSLGAVAAELLTGYVLFQNDSIATMLARITGIMGPFPSHVLRSGRESYKYFTPDKIVYDKIGPHTVLGPGSGGGPSSNSSHRRGGKLVEEDEQAILIYPKRTTLAARLHLPEPVYPESEEGELLDFVGRLLELDHERRVTAAEALGHPWMANAEEVDVYYVAP